MIYITELFAPEAQVSQRGVWQDAVGQRFGRMLVLSEAPKRGVARYVECKCDCGKVKTVCLANLRKGNVKSCGCLRSERVSATHLKHGHMRRNVASPTYATWCHVRSKCHNPNAAEYEKFGARGVTVCDAWRVDFSAFLRDMGERPQGHALALIDDATVFGPGSCEWKSR